MTENLPAVRPDTAPATAADVDSWTHVIGDVSRLAAVIADTEFVPKGLRGSAPAVTAALLYGREVGLPPMTALTQTHVIEGKPAISAEAMRALVLAGGHELEFMDSTGARCVVRGRRRGSERWVPVEWTIDMARAANLLGKQVWKSYPRAMLQARATAELCRLVFPDVIRGFRAVEEMEEEPATTSGPDTAQRTTRVRRQGTPPVAAVAEAPPAPPKMTAAPPLALPGEPGFDAPPETPAEPSSEEPKPETEPAEPRKVKPAQLRMLNATLNRLLGPGTSRADALAYVAKLAGLEHLESRKDLTPSQASAVIDTLARCRDRDALDALLAATGTATTQPATEEPEAQQDPPTATA